MPHLHRNCHLFTTLPAPASNHVANESCHATLPIEQHYNYKGLLLGVPATLGYLFCVWPTLATTTAVRCPSGE
jgi:hypothetical protein